MDAKPDFGLLFEQSPDILLALLPDAPRYTMVAATGARWRATHTTPETLGRGIFEIFPDNPDDPGASGTSNLRASLDRVVKTRRADTMPVQKYDVRGPDGSFESRFWSPKNLPVLSESGELRYILHRVEDVTELVRASEVGDELRGRTQDMEREVIQRSKELADAIGDLREANAKLAELDRVKTEFFSNVSHEFRTPLTLILGPLEDELAQRIALPSDRRVRLETAHRNALRLLKLVNTLLDFSKIEAGRAQTSFSPTDLAALTRDVISGFRSATDKAELELVVDCPTLPEPVFVDRGLWERILLNLISNAFKHTFEGSITVALRGRGSHVELRVADTGVGIAASELPRIFERFHRIQRAPSRSHEGTGIGLALVRELAALHGGTVRAESTPQKGSTFTVSIKTGKAHLPTHRIVSGDADTPTGTFGAAYLEEAVRWLPDAQSGAPASSAGAPGSRPSVLWADDNSDMRSYVAHLLGASYEVRAVADGQEALEQARARPPDLVLSDVMMPRLDGFGLLRALRADERTRHIPVILVSARAGEESALGGLDAGADDYLVKPFSARELLARVRAHVNLTIQQRALEHDLELRVQERTAQLLETSRDLDAENAQRRATERKLESQLSRMNLLDHITRAVAERQDLLSIIQVVRRSVEADLPVQVCWIGLQETDAEQLGLKGRLVYQSDLSVNPLPLPEALSSQGLRALVYTPLSAEGKVLGVLAVGRRDADSFSSGECEFVRQLGEHVALAIRQAQLHESLRLAYDELRESQRTIMQQERLSALGQMASGIAHDINNAISPIALYADSLIEREQNLSTAAKGQLEIIRRAIDDVSQTVSRLREFYRPKELQEALLPVDLNEVALQTLELTRARWRDMAQRRGQLIEVRTDFAEQLPKVLGIDAELRDALTNLIFNAVDAMPTGGTLSVRTHVQGIPTVSAKERAGGPLVQLEVTDSGIGMNEETQRRCLEPFFTTKGERGTGLGLAMVYGTLRRHGADLAIRSQPGHGTSIVISFAAAPALVARQVHATPPVSAPIASLRLLIVDDDPIVLKSLYETLTTEGHEVTVADGGQAGIDAFVGAASAGKPFQVVITDLGMPHVDGRKVTAAVKASVQGTPVLLLTGWGQRPLTDSGTPVEVDRVLSKPPRLGELREALAQYASRADDDQAP